MFPYFSFWNHNHLVQCCPRPSAGFWKGGAGEGLVEDCGLMFPGAGPGFQVIGGVLKKFRRAKIFGVICVKNQNFRGCRVCPPFESATGSGSDNNRCYWVKK
jgi:hypothetical protein